MEKGPRIIMLFRCHNQTCPAYEQSQGQPITRIELRELSQPESAGKYICPTCGEMFALSEEERASNIKMLDDEALAS